MICAMSTKRELEKHIFIEPATKRARPYLVEYILLLVAEARQLTRDQLLNDGSDGHGIAMDLCSVLLWQDADYGVVNDGWFNAKDEPVLVEIFDVVCTLDGTPNDLESWNKLFALASKLS